MLVTLRLVQDSSGAPPFFIDPENLSNRIESPSSRTHGLEKRRLPRRKHSWQWEPIVPHVYSLASRAATLIFTVKTWIISSSISQDKTSPLPLVPGVVTQIMAKNYLALPQPSS